MRHIWAEEGKRKKSIKGSVLQIWSRVNLLRWSDITTAGEKPLRHWMLFPPGIMRRVRQTAVTPQQNGWSRELPSSVTDSSQPFFTRFMVLVVRLNVCTSQYKWEKDQTRQNIHRLVHSLKFMFIVKHPDISSQKFSGINMHASVWNDLLQVTLKNKQNERKKT